MAVTTIKVGVLPLLPLAIREGSLQIVADAYKSRHHERKFQVSRQLLWIACPEFSFGVVI